MKSIFNRNWGLYPEEIRGYRQWFKVVLGILMIN